MVGSSEVIHIRALRRCGSSMNSTLCHFCLHQASRSARLPGVSYLIWKTVLVLAVLLCVHKEVKILCFCIVETSSVFQ